MERHLSQDKLPEHWAQLWLVWKGLSHTCLPHSLLPSASLFILPPFPLYHLYWPPSEAQAAEHPLAEGINILN